MYDEVVKLFGSKCKTDEILLLIDGLKKLVRQGFYEHEFKDIISFCEENNIFWIFMHVPVRYRAADE